MAIVIPSKDASVTTFLVDDTFGNLITYSAGWGTAGTIEEFGSTTHFTSTAGVTATFAFDGTNVDVFGTVGPTGNSGPTVSSYSIDSGPVTLYTAPNTTFTLYSTHFFASPTLSSGQHTLTIAFNSGSTYFLDYIQYAGSIQASTTTTSATSASSFASTSIVTTATPLPTVSGNSSTNTPVLAGAVVGAFFGGAIMAVLCFFCWTYSRRREQPHQPSNPPLNLNEPVTYTTIPFNPSALYASSLQPGFTPVPPTRRPGDDSSDTPSPSMSAMTSDASNSHNHPPAYSKRREAFGSYAVTNGAHG